MRRSAAGHDWRKGWRTDRREIRFPRVTYHSPDVSPGVAARQVLRYRSMTPDQKLALADDLWDLAWDAVTAGVRLRHPECDEATVIANARAVFRRATD